MGPIFLIFDLKSQSDTGCLISCGTKLQIFGPKWDKVPVLCTSSRRFAFSDFYWVMQVIRNSPWCENIVQNYREHIIENVKHFHC